MSIKNAALIAFLGAILAAALLTWNLIFEFLSVMRGLIPAMQLLPTLIYAFSAITMTIFFYVYQKRS